MIPRQRLPVLTRTLLQPLPINAQIRPPKALQHVRPHIRLGELEQLGPVPIHAPLHPPKRNIIIMRQRRQHGIHLCITQLIPVPNRVRLRQVRPSTRRVKDEVRQHLLQLHAGQVARRVDGAQDVEDGRVVGFRVLDEDREADVEEICLDRKVVYAFRGHDTLAELAEGHHYVREGLCAGGIVEESRGGGRGDGGVVCDVEGGEAAEEFVALAGVGAECHVPFDDLCVVLFLRLEGQESEEAHGSA